jgi:hypothetical protein
VSLVFGLGAFAIAASPHVQPNKEGLDKCLLLHPERYCRIANGFPVKPLDSSAQ